MKDTRCVHLDFHTSEEIEGIGADFDRKAFAAALKEAELDSITVFAKCHHGCFYYPSKTFFTHPHLALPLLDEQVEACREAGVSAKIYVSAGFDEYSAREHPEWLVVSEDGSRQNAINPGFKRLCFNTPYLDRLIAQTKEVVERYHPDGIFFDICADQPCLCRYCLEDMKKKGLDFRRHGDVMKQAKDVFLRYTEAMEKTVHEISPQTVIFHNCGDFPVGKNYRADCCDQIEMESLPTGGWGYDHFPLSVSYTRRLGKNCIGMTGKFHATWGEFGGYKYKDALLYEGAQCLAFDSGFSVGDQLHPRGAVDAYTYESIGKTMRYLKERTPYRGGEYLPELAVLSPEGTGGRSGIGRILFEGKYLFDLIADDEISNRYPLIILPDSHEMSEQTAEKLRAYTQNGGKILAFGANGLLAGQIPFDLGAKVVGTESEPLTYIRARYPLAAADGMKLAIYGDRRYYGSYYLEATGEVLADRIEPYFKREPLHFCSHNNIPADDQKTSPAITEGKDGIYVCASLTNNYFDRGDLAGKQLVLPLIDRLLGGRKTVKTNLPSSGKVTLYRKPGGAYTLFALYGNTVARGNARSWCGFFEVIEDLVTIADVSFTLSLPTDVNEAILRPSGERIPLKKEADGKVSFTLEKLHCMEIIELR